MRRQPKSRQTQPVAAWTADDEPPRVFAGASPGRHPSAPGSSAGVRTVGDMSVREHLLAAAAAVVVTVLSLLVGGDPGPAPEAGPDASSVAVASR